MDPVGIANIALGQVGGKLITSMGDASTEAKLCAVNFDAVRDAVLEERQWSFATGRLSISRDALTADELASIEPWAARFTLPTTVVRVLTCEDSQREGRAEWVREGRSIIADTASVLYVRAIMRVEDTALWSPGFVQAMAVRLAAVLSVPLSGNRQLQADLWGLYAKLLKEAGTLDGMQGRAERRRSDTLLMRRY